MRRFLLLVVVVGLVVVGVAAFGGTLPEGNPLRDATQALRDFGSAVADTFGGGYTLTTP